MGPNINANIEHRDRMKAMVENGSIMRDAIEIFKTCDKDCIGVRTWQNGQIRDFVHAVFQEHDLVPPTMEPQHCYELFKMFDYDNKQHLDIQQCLCLVDALFRAVCYAYR